MRLRAHGRIGSLGSFVRGGRLFGGFCGGGRLCGGRKNLDDFFCDGIKPVVGDAAVVFPNLEKDVFEAEFGLDVPVRLEVEVEVDEVQVVVLLDPGLEHVSCVLGDQHLQLHQLDDQVQILDVLHGRLQNRQLVHHGGVVEVAIIQAREDVESARRHQKLQRLELPVHLDSASFLDDRVLRFQLLFLSLDLLLVVCGRSSSLFRLSDRRVRVELVVPRRAVVCRTHVGVVGQRHVGVSGHRGDGRRVAQKVVSVLLVGDEGGGQEVGVLGNRLGDFAAGAALDLAAVWGLERRERGRNQRRRLGVDGRGRR